MKVTSPVGEFPFEAHQLRREGASIVLEGAMGAWPASVTVDAGDAPMMVRLIPVPVRWAAAALTVMGLIAVLRRCR